MILECKERKVTEDIQAHKVLRVSLVILAQRDPKDRKAMQVILVWKVHLDKEEGMAYLEIVVTLVHQA